MTVATRVGIGIWLAELVGVSEFVGWRGGFCARLVEGRLDGEASSPVFDFFFLVRGLRRMGLEGERLEKAPHGM